MFVGPKNMMINGGTFNMGAQNRVKGIELLHQKIAPGAFHDAAERFDAPKCHAHTREAILAEIMEWIRDIHKLKLFLWLYGPAGAGKSSIAQSIAELCHKAGILDGSFFFSRTAAGRNNDRFLIPTLTYQLTLTIPEMLQFVGQALDHDSLVFERSLQAQIDALILKPLSEVAKYRRNLEQGSDGRPIFIIIDGLDECGEAQNQRYILSALSHAVQQSEIPLLLLIASRPEQNIRQAFNGEPLNSQTHRLVLDDNYQPDQDIKVYLQSEFDEIKKNHPSKDFFPESWPSESDMQGLVQKSSGQFIYPSTVMKFITSSRHQPIERLNMILGLQPTGNNMPFAELDALYIHIFSAVADIEAVTQVFEVYLLFTPRSNRSVRVDDIEKFLCLNPGELQIILSDLHSIMYVPSPKAKDESPDSESNCIRLYHASISDFLYDKARSGRLSIDVQDAHARLARCCIMHMPSTFLRLGYHMDCQEHQLLSHLGFMDQCRKAYPREELVQDLYDFDFEGFLNYEGYHLEKGWLAKELPPFFEWIKAQCNSRLYQLYIGHFDNYVRARLSKYPQEPHSHLLFAAFTLPLYTQTESVDLLPVVTQGMDPLEPTHFKQADENGLYLNTAQYNLTLHDSYHSMLVDFFIDPTRSSIYHVNKSGYVSLASKCLECLADSHSNGEVWRVHASLCLLRRILLHIPSDCELATVLRDNPLPPTDRYSRTSVVIESYIQDSKIAPRSKKKKRRCIVMEKLQVINLFRSFQPTALS